MPSVASEMAPQVCELIDHNQPAASGSYVLLLQNPGMRVRHEYGVQTAFERWIDIRLRTVADHPGSVGMELPLRHQSSVGFAVLLLDDRRVRKMGAQARPIQFEPLLIGMPLRKKRQLVPRS